MKFLFFFIFNVYFILILNIKVQSVNNKGNPNLEMDSILVNSSRIDINKLNKDVKIGNKFLKKEEANKNLFNMVHAIQKNPSTKIHRIETQIFVKKHKTEGEIYEKVKFVLQDGIFDSIVRKVSLGGTSDKQMGFKLASGDVILTGAKVISNCIEPSSIYEHPYVCIIAQFRPVDATIAPIEIEIEYEYTSENLLRRREKPFSSQEQENVIVWIYDNNKKQTPIDSISLNIKFEDEIDINKIMAYPEKFLVKHHFDKNATTVSWNVKDLKPNSFKNFALNIPIFNHVCKGMNELHMEITTYSVIQFFIGLTISLVVLTVLSYIYLSKQRKEMEHDEDSNNSPKIIQNFSHDNVSVSTSAEQTNKLNKEI